MASCAEAVFLETSRALLRSEYVFEWDGEGKSGKI